MDWDFALLVVVAVVERSQAVAMEYGCTADAVVEAMARGTHSSAAEAVREKRTDRTAEVEREIQTDRTAAAEVEQAK